MNKYSGSNFDDFLDEEGMLEEVSERAQKRLLALKIQDIMDDSLNKEGMPEEVSARAPNVKASNHHLFDLDDTSITLECRNRLASMVRQPNHRLFDPDNTSITLELLNRLQQMVSLANQPAPVEFLRQEAGGL